MFSNNKDQNPRIARDAFAAAGAGIRQGVSQSGLATPPTRASGDNANRPFLRGNLRGLAQAMQRGWRPPVNTSTPPAWTPETAQSGAELRIRPFRRLVQSKTGVNSSAETESSDALQTLPGRSLNSLHKPNNPFGIENTPGFVGPQEVPKTDPYFRRGLKVMQEKGITFDEGTVPNQQNLRDEIIRSIGRMGSNPLGREMLNQARVRGWNGLVNLGVSTPEDALKKGYIYGAFVPPDEGKPRPINFTPRLMQDFTGSEFAVEDKKDFRKIISLTLFHELSHFGLDNLFKPFVEVDPESTIKKTRENVSRWQNYRNACESEQHEDMGLPKAGKGARDFIERYYFRYGKE